MTKTRLTSTYPAELREHGVRLGQSNGLNPGFVKGWGPDFEISAAMEWVFLIDLNGLRLLLGAERSMCEVGEPRLPRRGVGILCSDDVTASVKPFVKRQNNDAIPLWHIDAVVGGYIINADRYPSRVFHDALGDAVEAEGPLHWIVNGAMAAAANVRNPPTKSNAAPAAIELYSPLRAPASQRPGSSQT